MGRRIELGSIASGLIGSFNSRNNDVAGYWAIGKLHKFVEKEVSKVVLVDLLSGSMHPPSSEFNALIKTYQARLTSYLKARDLCPDWILSVEITAVFETEFEKKNHYSYPALGKPYKLKCDILDDKGKHHVAYAYGFSKPHDPSMELRSGR